MATRRVVGPRRPGLETRRPQGREGRGPGAGAGAEARVPGELGNTGQFSLPVPGGAGSPCVSECVHAKFSRVGLCMCASVHTWAQACARECPCVCVCVCVCVHSRAPLSVPGGRRRESPAPSPASGRPSPPPAACAGCFLASTSLTPSSSHFLLLSLPPSRLSPPDSALFSLAAPGIAGCHRPACTRHPPSAWAPVGGRDTGAEGWAAGGREGDSERVC